MQALGTLAGGIAHDFNNLLVPIVGYGGLLLAEAPEGTPSHRRLRRIAEAAKQAKGLVEQILTFSRAEEGQMAPLDLTPLAKEVVRLYRPGLPAGVAVDLYTSTDVSAVMADPVQMHQVLMNLMSNAVAAIGNEAGEVVLELKDVVVEGDLSSRHPQLDGATCVCLTVRDSGCGMTPEVAERAFEPFFTTKGVGEGTGLGLSMVHGIVTGHQGVIDVESEPGTGSTFRVYLPATEEKRRSSPNQVGVVPRGTERVFLVDDEAYVLEALHEVLEDLGYQVESETNSSRALLRFREDPKRFDLVVTDQVMPELRGTDLARQILECRPDVPIILCTGFSDTLTAQTALSAGIQAFVRKPVDTDTIGTTVRQVLDAGVPGTGSRAPVATESLSEDPEPTATAAEGVPGFQTGSVPEQEAR
jgi:CheY-like chemotaxis protein